MRQRFRVNIVLRSMLGLWLRILFESFRFLPFARSFSRLSLPFQSFGQSGVCFRVIRIEAQRFPESRNRLIDVATLHLRIR